MRKPVVGFEDRYLCDDEGVIWSQHTGRPLTTKYNSRDKYGRVNLFDGVKFHTKTVHSVILATFVGPRPTSAVIRHLDGNARNNRIDNLKYGSQSENALDTVAHGRNPKAQRTSCPRGHSLSGPNLVSWFLARGYRNCLACSRAKSRLSRVTHPEFQRVSDLYYEEIINVRCD